MNREKLLKIAKPILFNTEMVQAILEGRKTVTRRVIKPQPNEEILLNWLFADGVLKLHYDFESEFAIKAPFNSGDILYVREAWLETNPNDCTCYECNGGCMPKYVYRADIGDDENYKWKPSIHMPRELARMFLKVTDVRVERFQDITVGDIEKEGYPNEIDFSTMPIAMQGLMFEWWVSTWNSTIKNQDLDQYGWEANPFVWVIEFERIEVIK